MKTLYIANGSNICVDVENNTAEMLDSEREGIQRIYLAKEPMHVVYTSGEYRREFDVKKDDLIITFYSGDFQEKAIVAKSKDWVKNLKELREREQKLKEEWAEKNAQCCDNCVPESSC